MNRFLLLSLLALLPLELAAAGVAPEQPAVYADRAGAIRGYDPVAYFTDSEAVRGDRRFRHRWREADWFFASAEHRDLFAADPARYAPQYGGYCAYAMSRGDYVSSDPDAWSIRDGRLYLNYSKRVRRTWLKEPEGYIERADGHWRRLRGGDG